MMMEVKQLHGTEDELYRLVAPLVMNPVVLKQNYNFPFRTSDRFEWTLALNEEEQVIGFIPVECKCKEAVINNYYIKGKEADVLAGLLAHVIDVFSNKSLIAVVFREDVGIFNSLGFVEEKTWTRYVRMKKEPEHGEEKRL